MPGRVWLETTRRGPGQARGVQEACVGREKDLDVSEGRVYNWMVQAFWILGRAGAKAWQREQFSGDQREISYTGWKSQRASFGVWERQCGVTACHCVTESRGSSGDCGAVIQLP